MVRPRRCRRISFQPDITYFKPAGVPLHNLDETIINYDETEAVRLVDLEEQDQNQVAKKMQISQPTLSRLLKSGRKKLAEAIIKGKAIKIHGGNFKMIQPRGRGLGMRKGRELKGGRGRISGPTAGGPGGICKCPKCEYTEPQVKGQPCMNKKCPKCKTAMIRREQ